MKEAPPSEPPSSENFPGTGPAFVYVIYTIGSCGACAGENPVGFGWFPRCTQTVRGIRTDTRDPTGSRGIFRAPEKMPESRFCRTQQEFGNQKSRICRGNRQSGFCFYGGAAFRPPARRIFCGICFLWNACCSQRFCGIGSPDDAAGQQFPPFVSPLPFTFHPFLPFFGLSTETGISPLPPDCPLISHVRIV